MWRGGVGLAYPLADPFGCRWKRRGNWELVNDMATGPSTALRIERQLARLRLSASSRQANWRRRTGYPGSVN